MAYREYANSAGAIVDQGGNGDFLTLAAAMASATSGTTIFLKPGTYTENVTLKAGVNITAFTCDAYTPNVTISGTLTASFSGNVSISGIKLQTNGTNPFLNVTGASGVIFINCFFNCTTNTGMITSNASANITCYSCQSSSISNFTLFNLINIGSLNFYGCVLRNTGNSTTASTTAAGVVAFNNTYCEFVLTTSSGGTLDIRNSLITSVGAATTAITTAGTGNSLITLTKILSGSSSAVSIGTGTMVAMSNCVVDSTNTNAIISRTSRCRASIASPSGYGSRYRVNFRSSRGAEEKRKGHNTMYDNLLANVPTDLWIGGKWRKSSDGGRFDVIDPATENKVASVASATVEDADAPRRQRRLSRLGRQENRASVPRSCASRSS